MHAIIGFPLRSCLLSLVLVLAACGGGGGGGGGGSSGPAFVSLSPGTLNFSAASPSAAVPASQLVTATVTGVTSGVLFVKVVIDGVVVTSVGTVTVNPSTQQGTAPVIVASPGSLGTGTHTATITVSVCTTDVNCSGAQLAGSPKTITVNYTVGSSVQADAVAPYVGTSNLAGDVTIRGQGFTPATSVSFGGAPAMAFSVVSDTEIHATYPALTAGTYAVQVSGKSGPAFTESLKIIDAPAYASTTLGYPSAPQIVRGLVYDAERGAVLAAVGFANASNNTLLRYAFASNAWGAPASLPFASLRDIALSQNGSKLLAISDASMTELDPATLGTITTVAKPDSFFFGANEFMRGMAVANDGLALVTTGFNGSGDTGLYAYSPSHSTFFPMAANSFTVLANAAAGASANGATVALMQTGRSPAQPAFRYTASTGVLASSGVAFDQSTQDANEHINAPAFDRAGTRMIVAASAGILSPYRVYDASFAALGQLPTTTAGYAVSPDGTRAYTVEIASPCTVRAFNLVALTDPLTEIMTGYPITLPSCPGNTDFPQSIKMLVNPAGDTAFIAGNLQINVVPLP